MATARDLEAELRTLQQGMMRVFRQTFPSKQFHAELMLGVISLELTLRQLSRSRDLKERRRLKTEFDHGLSVIRKGLNILWESRWGEPKTEPKQAAQTGGHFFEAASSPSPTG